MDSLGSGTKGVTSSISLSRKCLADIAVVPIFRIQKDEEDKFYEIFSKSLYFKGLQSTRKTQEIGKHM